VIKEIDPKDVWRPDDIDVLVAEIKINRFDQLGVLHGQSNVNTFNFIFSH